MQKRVCMASIKSNLNSTKRKRKVKIEEAKDKWEKRTKRIKKRKEEEFLDTQDKKN